MRINETCRPLSQILPCWGVRTANAERRKAEANRMANEHFLPVDDAPPSAIFGHRTRASYEQEVTEHRCPEARLRQDLANNEAMIRQQSILIQRQEILSRESDHRFLNGLQMITSVLSLQSRTSANPEVASQSAVAARRVSTIERAHRQLQQLCILAFASRLAVSSNRRFAGVRP
jgi:two-component sensor histidine kinase